MVKHPTGEDPRKTIDPNSLDEADRLAYPQMAVSRGGKLDFGMLAIVIAALAIGGVTWLSLTAHKTPVPEPAPVPQIVKKPPPPQQISRIATLPHRPSRRHPSRLQTRHSDKQILIVDNSTPAQAAPRDTKDKEKGAGENNLLNGNDKFVAGLSQDVGKATRIAAPSMTVPQGAILPAVLETALNTDLPGYARAIVSRDVRSFDGANILIPRGTRLIGQYKSGLSSGVTRVFVIWTRLIRPDGVSVKLGAPAMDGKGQTGLAGDVETHFWKRFGAAMLLSVVSGVSSLGSGSTIVIGSSSAQSAASDALSADTNIPPTIKVPQGTAIQVFVSQDLDFSEIE